MQQIAVVGSLQDAHKSLTLAEAFMSVEVLILADHSGSMSAMDAGEGNRSRWDEANTQLAILQRKYPGRLGLIAFSDYALFCPGGALPHVAGGTNMIAALELVKPADGAGIRLIVVSDGCPNDPEGTLSLARTFESSIDTIYIGTDPQGKTFMEALAKAGRGKSVTRGVSLLSESVVLLLEG